MLKRNVSILLVIIILFQFIPGSFTQNTTVLKVTGNLATIDDNELENRCCDREPPNIENKDITEAYEDQLYLSDYNCTDPEGDKCTWSLKTEAPFLSIDEETGILKGTPGNQHALKEFDVNITATDNWQDKSYRNFTLFVYNVNDPPTIITDDVIFANEDQPYWAQYHANDIDPTGDIFTWDLLTNAVWLNLSDDEGNLTGLPENKDVGEYWVNVSVLDDKGGIDTHNFTLIVNNTNDAPVISTADQNTAYEDQLYLVTYNATDPDVDDTLIWQYNSTAGWLSFNSTNRTLFGVPENHHVGIYQVNISVNDGSACVDFHNFSLEVQNTNDPPVINHTEVDPVEAGSFFELSFDWYDIDGDGAIWFMETNSTWLFINQVEGVVSGEIPEGAEGSYWINVSVFDGGGDFDWINVTLIVLPAPPVLYNITVGPVKYDDETIGIGVKVSLSPITRGEFVALTNETGFANFTNMTQGKYLGTLQVDNQTLNFSLEIRHTGTPRYQLPLLIKEIIDPGDGEDSGNTTDGGDEGNGTDGGNGNATDGGDGSDGEDINGSELAADLILNYENIDMDINITEVFPDGKVSVSIGDNKTSILYLNETTKVDLDGDGIKDIELIFKGYDNDGKPILEGSVLEKKAQEIKELDYTWVLYLVIGIIIVLALVSGVIMYFSSEKYKKKEKKHEKKKEKEAKGIGMHWGEEADDDDDDDEEEEEKSGGQAFVYRCPNCQAVIPEDAEECKGCGVTFDEDDDEEEDDYEEEEDEDWEDEDDEDEEDDDYDDEEEVSPSLQDALDNMTL